MMGRLLISALLAFALAACAPDVPRFNNTDITGAGYGRDFSLTDHNGTLRSLADFRGKVVVMFFGFTHCPDVCPTTLGELKLALQQLGDDAKKVQVLFVTVDPERDTQALLAQYVPAFDPGFIGLYGDAAATKKAAGEFKVFYQKVKGANPETYTAGSYVIDSQGRLRLFVRHGGPIAPLVADLRMLLSGR